MSWFNKLSDQRRYRGQIPFSNPAEGKDDTHNPQNPDYPEKKDKKNMTEVSPGMGSEKHRPKEISINDMAHGNDSDSTYVDPLSSRFDVDSELYGGQIMEEGPGGNLRPRDSDQGGPSIGDSPSVLGIEDDAVGSYNLRHTPNDANTKEVSINNFLRSLKNKSKVNVNGLNVNV